MRSRSACAGAARRGLRPCLVLLALCLVHGAASDASALVCKSQGALRLDAPLQQPAWQPEALPFCTQFSRCTCCNVTHAAALSRGLRAALADDALSAGCKAVVTRLACRVCDPLVGVGLRPAVCGSLCDEWRAACRDDFFEWHREELVPCSVEAQRALVCQRLGDLSRSGAELCARAGLAAAAAGCYDGRPPRPLESCRTPPARARRRAPAGPPAGRAAAWLSADRLLVAAGAAGLFLAWRAAARRRGPGVRSPRAPAALPWGADARFPGGPRFLNE